MQLWTVKMEVSVEAEDRSEAWQKGREIANQVEGDIISVSLEPDEEE